MAYEVVKIQDWVITGVNGQPARGFLVTVLDQTSGDRFSLEVENTQPETIKRAAAAEIERRRGSLGLKLD